MLPTLIWLLLAPWLPMESPEAVAERNGATCERGCIVGADGWAYEVTRDDLVWLTRSANCEIGSHLDTEDAPATMWALAQNFYRRHLVGRQETLGEFVSNYSACTSKRWATGGSRYSPRITPIADANRRTRWRDLPQRTRDFVRSFLRNEIPNRWPGWCYVWTHGWEHHASPRIIGPYYAAEDVGRSLNAYYKDPLTVWFMPWTVRIVAPPAQD
jgi:hypothetical protein